MEYATISLIFKLAALQGFILAFSLIFKKARTPANLILGVWLALLSLDLVFQGMTTENFKVIIQFPVLTTIVSGLGLIHGPMLYLYTAYLTAEKKFDWKHLFHFTPFLINKAGLIGFYFKSGVEQNKLLEDFLLHPPAYSKISTTMIGIHGLTYTVLALIIISRYGKKVLEYFSNTEKAKMKWLQVLISLNFIPWIIVILLSITMFFTDIPAISGNILIYMPVTIIIYMTGYFGFNQTLVFPQKDDIEIHDIPLADSRKADLIPDKKETLKILKRKKVIIEKLINVLDQKIWLEPELTIQDVSNRIKIPIHQISRVISEEFQCNFFTLINTYRLEEARKRLLQKEFDEHTVLQIALECGFNSKSSFNSIFKKQTGLTPTEYKHRSQKN